MILIIINHYSGCTGQLYTSLFFFQITTLLQHTMLPGSIQPYLNFVGCWPVPSTRFNEGPIHHTRVLCNLILSSICMLPYNHLMLLPLLFNSFRLLFTFYFNTYNISLYLLAFHAFLISGVSSIFFNWLNPSLLMLIYDHNKDLLWFEGTSRSSRAPSKGKKPKIILEDDNRKL